MEFSTPMMKQYGDIKSQYQDCLLFFRLGDFFELFMEDAKIGSAVMDITLTARDRGSDGKIPMAGVPYHALDSYVSKCIKAGYRVAICDQLTEPDKNGLVERGVIRVITPGTLTDEKTLESKSNNYVCNLIFEDGVLGVSYADVSTGQFYAYEVAVGKPENLSSSIVNELSVFSPSECILSFDLYKNEALTKALKIFDTLSIIREDSWDSSRQISLNVFFKVKDLSAFGLINKPKAQKSATTLLDYLRYTQKDKVEHFRKICSPSNLIQMELDWSTVTNLELYKTIREGSKKGSLLHALDLTVTPMGARKLKELLVRPLLNLNEITDRHDVVDELLGRQSDLESLRNAFSSIHDIERILSRLSIGTGNPRDLINIKNSLIVCLGLSDGLNTFNSNLIKSLLTSFNDKIKSIISYIDNTIIDECPIDPKTGGFIKKGVNAELDALTTILTQGQAYLIEMEQREKNRTGIASLKVRYNQVFGYYIEVTKSNLDQVPEDYFRKQTMVNAERFITKELKEQEEKIVQAEEKSKKIEHEIFMKSVEFVVSNSIYIQDLSASIALLDVLASFAYLAFTKDFCRPKISNSLEISILDGRHPVVEDAIPRGEFIPNDTSLGTDSILHIITGPNMGGKSVYIRQVAVICLLNQIGSFVPAKAATLPILDRIFVRSGASDVISMGLSTFMVEMVETAFILNHATSKSLIILDEIGRGTSTYDGVSIAWSVAASLVEASEHNPLTLFATHYHELQSLSETYTGKVKNYQLLVEKKGKDPIFMHKVVLGGASHSYGIEVAKLAGMPDSVVKMAQQKLKELEKINHSHE